jgi:predicted nucleic acid-binding protein
MGVLTLPASGLVCVDANLIIYTVEKHPVYEPLLRPLWQSARSKSIEVVSSELALMETLIGPLKSGDAALQRAYDQALLGTELRLIPITQSILREAARLRSISKLRTPDAIHAATALLVSCALFITNDVGFRTIPRLPVVILDDLLKP